MRSTLRFVVASLVVVAVGVAPAVVAADQQTIGKRKDAAGSAVVERVRMVNFAFRPRSLTISAGTRVRWVNNEGTHSSTSNTGRWDSGVLSQGEAYGRVFRNAGTFKYHCSVHPSNMRGVITVT